MFLEGIERDQRHDTGLHGPASERTYDNILTSIMLVLNKRVPYDC